MKVKAWHFVSADRRLRDGRPLPAVGELLVEPGPIKLYKKGLHGSRRLIDALGYAPGPVLCRTVHSGEILYGDDKLCSSGRIIIAMADVSEVLRKFARLCALDVVHLWDAPDVVIQYLKTGDVKTRHAAMSAARTAAMSAARAAAMSAAGAAAVVAARSAAGAAVWATAGAKHAAKAKQNRRLTAMVSRVMKGGGDE